MAKDKTLDLPRPLGGHLSFHPLSRVLRRFAEGWLLQGIVRVRLGAQLVALTGAQPGATEELDVRRPLRLLWRAAVGGDLGFGQAYVAGDWDSPDLRGLLCLLAVNEPGFASLEGGALLHRIADRLQHWRNRNSRSGSRRNIAFHYDLGNDFYRLWLDPTMTYSCALFQDEAETLEQAQRNKYRRLLGLLEANAGQHVLEIGCGWGGFAREAGQAGLQVTGITLSEAQLGWARDLARREGLEGSLQLRLQDYRDLDEQFDHIVSIEMFEAVGEAYWDRYMETLKRSLRPGGRAAIQVITIDEPTFAVYRERPDFVQRYVFPGGMLPTPQRFMQAATNAGLKITAQDFFGQDYARTLTLWYQAFEAQQEAVRAIGFDERFLRIWRYYLAYCEAGFRDGRIDLMQVRLEHA